MSINRAACACLLVAALALASPRAGTADSTTQQASDVLVGQHADGTAAPTSPPAASKPPDPADPGLLEIPAAPDAVRTLELPGAVLTLQDALERALQGNPALGTFDYEVRAAQGREIQGSLKPNPELEGEVSQFLGTAEMRFFRSAITGVGISQLIERGEKRCARMTVAEREGDVARNAQARARLDLLLGASRAYYAVLIAQEKLRLALEREQLAQQVYDVVKLRVEGGKAAQLELSRVHLDQVTAQIDREQQQRQFDRSRVALAALWGASTPDFGSVDGRLTLPTETPQREQLDDLLSTTPDIQQWQAEEALRQAKLDLACAEGRPDLTVHGGLERFEDTDSLGFKVGVSIPLPWHNHNEGAVSEAQAYVDQVDSLREADLRKAHAALSATYADLTSAYARAARLRDEVLPAAQDTFDLTNYGFRYGKFSVLDVLDAERTLIDGRTQYTAALADYQLAAVELERLIAQPLATPADTPQAAAPNTAGADRTKSQATPAHKEKTTHDAH